MSNTDPNAPRAWTVNVVKSARKQLDRLCAVDFARVDAAIESMRVDPFMGDIEHLKNADAGHRRRAGNYRILFDVFRDRRHIEVVAVERRTSTTYRKRRR
jgi:mRNA-degrading endonuclease RelE of RelBE toxin-antitoxin system